MIFSWKTPLLTAEEETILFAQWSTHRDAHAFSRLVFSHLRLVSAAVRKMQVYSQDTEDLFSTGTEGLIKAIHKFNPSRSTRLASYAIKWIIFYIRCYILDSQPLTATPHFFKLCYLRAKYGPELSAQHIAAHLRTSLTLSEALLGLVSSPLPLEAVTESLRDPAFTPEDSLIQANMQQYYATLLQNAVLSLRPQERYIFKRRLLKDPPLTLKALSARCGLSPERIRQIQHQAIAKVTKRLRWAISQAF